MTPTRSGSIRLFRIVGISVYLHWSWFLVLYYFYAYRKSAYSSPIWNVAECLGLFAIVLLHEFGHSLACRQVGGQANQIVLWPLGGVAYVAPPQRPGASLWCIAAGPLVNMVLFPVLGLLLVLRVKLGWEISNPDLYIFVLMLFLQNGVILGFNLLPVYPLDGGQILRSLLWFAVGRANSLIIATITGFIGAAALIGLAVWMNSIMLGILCAFMLLHCVAGLWHALGLARIAKAPQRQGFACPACKTPPPQGKFWLCGKCRKQFDTFETLATCPNCGTQFGATSCPECNTLSPIADWAGTGHSLSPPP